MTDLPTAVVVVCTKDRPSEMQELLRQLSSQTVVRPLLVVDASVDQRTRSVVEAYGRQRPAVWMNHPPGLARQRNAAIQALGTSDPPEILCFLDDDVLPAADYIETVLTVFARDRTVSGVGAIVDDRRRLPKGVVGGLWRTAKRVFLLEGQPGRVLPSGRNIMVRNTNIVLPVDWLPGSAMSYRFEVFADHRFDGRLRGYSWGEDFDFSFRVSRNKRLVVTPDATVVNLLAPTNRQTVARLGQVRTVLLHAWVSEQEGEGMSRVAFWWSVVGEILLQSLLGIGRAGARAQAVGVARGVLHVLRSGSSRDIDPNVSGVGPAPPS